MLAQNVYISNVILFDFHAKTFIYFNGTNKQRRVADLYFVITWPQFLRDCCGGFLQHVLTLYREWVLHCWPACLPYTVCTRPSFPAGCTTCSARRDICPSELWLSRRWWSAPLSRELCRVYTLYSGLISLPRCFSICSFHAIFEINIHYLAHQHNSGTYMARTDNFVSVFGVGRNWVIFCLCSFSERMPCRQSEKR